MRTYVFHHVMYGDEPLTGDSLIKEVLAVTKALPGYELWCRHRHEIEDRVSEWVSCIEKSHYFHYGEQFGKYKSKKERSESENTEPSWNQQQSQKTKNKIQAALKELSDKNELPEQATARFNALRKFGIGGGSLYRYKELWHPLWKLQPKSPQTPQRKNESGQFDHANAPNCHSSTSLLQGVDGNNNKINSSSDLKSIASQPEGGNPHREEIQRIREMLSTAQVAVDCFVVVVCQYQKHCKYVLCMCFEELYDKLTWFTNGNYYSSLPHCYKNSQGGSENPLVLE